MSTSQILAELPKLSPAERQEVRRCLARLDGDEWLEDGGKLSEAEKSILGERLAEYEFDPDEGSSWEEVEVRLRDRLKA